LLIHLIDGASEDPLADLNVVEKELAAYGHGLLERPRLLVLNKRELLNQELENNLVESIYKVSEQKLILISAAMGKGLDVLLDQVWKQLGK
jgi:GTP-binding protein